MRSVSERTRDEVSPIERSPVPSLRSVAIASSKARAARRTWTRWLRPLGGAAILAAVVWRIGGGPFWRGIAAISLWPLLAAVGIAVLTTFCCAYRWTLVARGLGVGVPLRRAVASYYRSQFLNSTLPGGVLGDVHRGVRHGHEVGDVGRGLRAVAWERSAGQVLQVALAVIVLAVLPSPVHAAMPYVVATLVVVSAAFVLAVRSSPRSDTSRWARSMRAVRADIREGLLAASAWPGIVLTSLVVVTGHVVTFLIAARVAGSDASPIRILPLALLVLLSMGLPTSVGGWGPREGVAGWLFGAVGLGASLGVSTAVVYGVMALAACLPGAAVLTVAWLRDARHRRREHLVAGRSSAIPGAVEAATHG